MKRDRSNQSGAKSTGKSLGKDTEEVALPPVEHVEADGDIVEVDLAPDPVHPRRNEARAADGDAAGTSLRSESSSVAAAGQDQDVEEAGLPLSTLSLSLSTFRMDS